MQMAEGRSGAALVGAVEKRLRTLGWVVAAAGSAVVFTAVGFLIPIFIDPADQNGLALLNGPLVLASLVLGGVLVQHKARHHLAEALGWIVDGRAPSEREHDLTLGLAVYRVKLIALGWVVAGVVFSVVNAAAHSVGFAAVVAATIWLGGETTCALDYLASERILRPLTARALSARLPARAATVGVRGRLAIAWALGTGVPLVGVAVVGMVGLTKSGVDTGYVAAAVLFLAVLASVVGPLATFFAARAIADPVTSVRAGLERIERGDLDVHLEVDDASEVGMLQAGFNRMAEGLRERELIRDLFGRQVGEEVARAALRDGSRLGGEEREIAALFVDLTGSTTLALLVPPHEVVELLNRFFHIVVEVTEANGGFVNKFEGDAALCVFGAPVAIDDPAGAALRAGRRLAVRLRADVPEIDFGVGVSAGSAVAGNVGAERRFEYTVIGDPVNEAARLSELAKERPERVLASNAALDKAGGSEGADWSRGESVVLRGRGALATGLAHPSRNH
jgi:adenylate cyclase